MHVNVDDIEVLAPTATAMTVMCLPSMLLYFLTVIRFALTVLRRDGAFEQHGDPAFARCHADGFPALGACRTKFLVAIVADCDEAVFESNHDSPSLGDDGEFLRNPR